MRLTDTHIWDFWDRHDPATGWFDVCYLNAPRGLVASNQHHFSAQMGHMRSRDFSSFTDPCHAAFTADPASWDNSAIWTGDVISRGDDLLLFYTSRDGHDGDGMTQRVGLARSGHGNPAPWQNWQRGGMAPLSADPHWYETASRPDEATIHAWRDPFVFRHGGGSCMLISAKARHLPPNRKGCIALLQADDDSLTSWRNCDPLTAPGLFAEMEVPHLVVDAKGQLNLLFSCQRQHVHLPADHPRHADLAQGGLYAMRLTHGASAS